jgi:hypothetical protein
MRRWLTSHKLIHIKMRCQNDLLKNCIAYISLPLLSSALDVMGSGNTMSRIWVLHRLFLIQTAFCGILCIIRSNVPGASQEIRESSNIKPITNFCKEVMMMPYWLKPRHIWWSQGSLLARWKQQYTTSELFNAGNKHALVCMQHSMRVYHTVAFRGHLGPF